MIMMNDLQVTNALLALIVLVLIFLAVLFVHGYGRIKARIASVEGYVGKVREHFEQISTGVKIKEERSVDLGVRAVYRQWQKSRYLSQKYAAYGEGEVEVLNELAPWMPPDGAAAASHEKGTGASSSGYKVDPPDPAMFRSLPEQLYYLACGSKTQAILLDTILKKIDESNSILTGIKEK